jgi:ATP-dependent DNA helicase RecG
VFQKPFNKGMRVSKQTNTDPRSMMERAIEEMRKCRQEPRDDSKVSPRVGAVLVKSDGSTQTAFRGELRLGDHAEFTLLERKNRDNDLTGATLYATLEPCAPGARKSPKLACAERIVNARIKEVWVGIEDPDPTVDRRGIKFLQDAGITVHMFDPEFQEIIRRENQEFLAQAMERAAAVTEEKTNEVVLSPLERPLDSDLLSELSEVALRAFGERAGFVQEIGTPEFDKRLNRLELLESQEGVLRPTGFGYLLFGKEPRERLRQAGLLATIRYPDGSEEVEDFDGPLVLVPEQFMGWLRSKLPNPISRSEAQRRAVNEKFFELVREGIVNALAHRDYAIAGAKCKVDVTPDRIEIYSPGAPVAPITLEQMQAFKAPSLSRNPVLTYVFSRMNLMEERGLGLRSMRDRAKADTLPPPSYSWDAPYLILTIYRSAKAVTADLPAGILDQLNTDERHGLEFLLTQERVTRREYAERMGFDDRKASRHLKRFVELKLLRPTGASSATAYELVKPE